MAYSLLIADDHAMVRQGLRQLLEKTGYRICAETASGEEACTAWREHRPDAVLMDMEMPGMGGLEALKRILAQDAKARVVMYSMYADSVHATRAFAAGAKGYVAKSESPSLLLEAVHQVLRGGRYLGHAIAREVTQHAIHRHDTDIRSLSPREFEVFRRLVNGQTLAQIADQLHISIKSVSNIQTRVRQKLGAATPAQLVAIAMRHGILRAGTPVADD
jgi:DNA-binding NarL/FixJ family response regulator